ncbi:MBL fold metallo-hydrolase [candidate division WOR-3 bacterium]|uniref:MBL fold metallo-hydrolase n=1 Tax=candidate division WOR-3 bacterium TaxID=2052148 RepID=A0A660SIJ6_UNCW3|nr:MAG: MBL fold metallo-hydrolase [candidate division WOR-3 bacterium]
MKFTFLGHAAFLIETKDGVRIITDPYKPGCYDNAVGYDPITEAADIVTVSHEHDDHNYTQDIKGDPVIVKGAGAQEVKGIKLTGFESYHDQAKGSQRGKNTIFLIEAEGMRIVHLGDLGHVLDDEAAKRIGPVDILLIPVGGFYTIDAGEAWQVVKKLNPRIVIPMHFKTEKLGFPIAKVNEFAFDAKDADWTERSEYEITKENLPEALKVVILNPLK